MKVQPPHTRLPFDRGGRQQSRVLRLTFLSVTPLLLLAVHVLALLVLFSLMLPNELEDLLLGVLWFGGMASSVALGLRWAAGGAVREPAWWVVLGVAVVIAPVVLTPLLGPNSGAALAVLALWSIALLGLALAGRRLLGTAGARPAAAFAAAGGALLAVLAAFLSARLNLPAEQATFASAPWWLPVAVTDHAFMPSLVNRLDALRIASGLSVTLSYAGAFVLAYTLRASGLSTHRLPRDSADTEGPDIVR